jgi:hypothetical protein
MKGLWLKLILIVSLIFCTSCNNVIISPPSEISDPHLNEIAMIRADPHWGAVVIYNPKTCIEIGDACGFFRLHAFAHNHLNHTLLATPKSYSASLETQADCWAAKLGKSNETYAAFNLFLDKNRNPEWKIHGDPVKRAENIRVCAIEAGRWLGKE